MKLPILLAALTMNAGPLSAMAAEPAKPVIVLVHGAWETAGIWPAVTAGLKHDGYRVRIVTLPGRPGNLLPMGQVTMAAYAKTIGAVLAKEPKPVVLVGHSFAGFPISVTAEAHPKRIKTLVYLAAYLPKDGDSLLALATTDSGSQVGPALVIDKEKGIASIKPEARPELFANGAPAGVGEAVAKAIVDEPLGPLVTPVHLTAANFGSVDKVYIHTAHDHVVSPPFQAKMIAATPVRLQLSVDTGHTPFVTNPPALIAAIEQAAK